MRTRSQLWNYSAGYIDSGNYVLISNAMTRTNTMFLASRGDVNALMKGKLVVELKTRQRNSSKYIFEDQDNAIRNKYILNYSIDILNEIADMLVKQHQEKAGQLIRSIIAMLKRVDDE